MSRYRDRSKQVRIALGIAGFFVLLAGTPCVLGMLRGGYVQGTDDIGGVFGVGGTALFVLFVGVSLLYQALKSPEASDDEPEEQ